MPTRPLAPIARRSLSDHVFQQLRSRILAGGYAPGDALPAERELCRALDVNRSALREALKRLDQAGLVRVRHGGSTLVLDYRERAGLDLLPHLLQRGDGSWDADVVASVMEMRSALAPDVARLAALRAEPDVAMRLDALVARMQDAADDLPTLQLLALEFWSELVRGCGNLGYRLAFNSLREAYARSLELLTEVMAEEFRDVPRYVALARAVTLGEADDAEAGARFLVGRGEARVKKALAALEASS